MNLLSSPQVSVTLENFQDISLPIPGKEDLARLHSATHQTSMVKTGSCGEAYAPQGWIAFVLEYIKRCLCIKHIYQCGVETAAAILKQESFLLNHIQYIVDLELLIIYSLGLVYM